MSLALILQIVGLAISAADVAVPEIDRIVARHECCCVVKTIYVRSYHAPRIPRPKSG